MAPITTPALSSKKRKAASDAKAAPKAKRRRDEAAANMSEFDITVNKLETELSKNSNGKTHMSELISLFDLASPDSESNLKVAICLCRVFSRMMATGHLPWRKSNEEPEWQMSEYLSYQSTVQQFLRNGHGSTPATMLKLHMRMLEEESSYNPDNVKIFDSFSGLISALAEAVDGAEAVKAFMEGYVQKYQDCCYYTLEAIKKYIQSPRSSKTTVVNVVELLNGLGPPPKSADDVISLFAPHGNSSRKPVVTANSMKRQAESAWRALLGSKELDDALRKTLLRQCTSAILPWMTRPESLMDFFTDSYNIGGSTSLLALSGLFHLINTKNLDYPSFYPKLYSLLDADLLHSKHRSRFLRLLNKFLSSTHLPASLIASFIKRLSRLALFAPPAAIVATIPYIYNLLKEHPTCTFMIHRHPYPPYTLSTDHLGNDPFDMFEPNPQLSHAIDSSLWELETLQSHYHPNVASLARIISEPFTKQQYNLEDFLDHGYANMLESELGREAKKAPVVEWKIPKRIFTKPGDAASEEEMEGVSLLQKLWDFS